MISITLAPSRTLKIKHLVLDLNGTLALDGELLSGVTERLKQLRSELTIHLTSADTQGTAARIAQKLDIELVRLSPGEGTDQKAALVQALGANGVIAMGNGANDCEMLRLAGIGIAVMGKEGAALPTLLNADIIVSDPCDGLDLLIKPKRLWATLRI